VPSHSDKTAAAFCSGHFAAMEHIALLFALLLGTVFSVAAQEANSVDGQKEGTRYRTYGQKYKDMVFSYCVAIAYKEDRNIYRDAYATAKLIYKFPLYEKKYRVAMKEAGVLIDQFLARTYTAPIFTHETGIDVPFSLAKCIDLYHSKALDANMRKFVPNPEELPKEP
jgi:hypothetical protein